MAIPFFEPRPSESTPHGDQVDGPGSPPPATASTTTFSNNSNTSTTTSYATTFTGLPPSSTSTLWPSADEQLLAWKILAVAMCKALKEYHLQSTNTKDAFTSANGSVVQILPNGEVQPIWK